MAWLIVLLVVALFVVPFMVGGYLAKRVRMPDYGWRIGVILWSLACAAAVVLLGGAPKLGIDLSGGVILVYEVDQTKKRDPGHALSDSEMDQLIAAIKKRVDPGGVKEVTIRRYGAEQIEIIIPEVDADEAALIKRMVSREGSLEFRILANPHDHQALISRALAETNARVLNDSQNHRLAWWVPVAEGKEQNFQNYLATNEATGRKRKYGDREVLEILVVQDDYNVTGGYLVSAKSSYDYRTGDPAVSFTLDSSGGSLFHGLTTDNRPDEAQGITRKLGIILDDYLQSAPALQSPIREQGQITGLDDQAEVQETVAVLNAGGLPTSLRKAPISELVTGPTLGQDTINRGKWAISVSMVIVLVFMLFYYRFAGIVACLALVANLLLILAVMITIKAAFTLPGLAGLVLTVGMAVDANVLIFERIREELGRGAALRMAIRNGFDRATTTIVDANLTTLITATILYIIGTDQVKGFAVTLWLGVVLSMYTAIFCSRVIFDIAERRRWISKLGMMRILGTTHFDFLLQRRTAAVFSLVVIVAGMAGVVARGKGLLDIDFTGGVAVEVVFDEEHPQKVGDLRKLLEEELPDLAVSDVQIENELAGLRFRINTSQPELADEGKRELVGNTLRAQLDAVPGAGPAAKRTSTIDAFAKRFNEVLETDEETPERTAARAALRSLIEKAFAQATDRTKAEQAVAAVESSVDGALMSATQLVERRLQDIFGAKLAHNTLTVGQLSEVKAAAAASTEEPASTDSAAKPSAVEPSAAQPETDQGARTDLPPQSLLAMAGSDGLLLAQAADAAPTEPETPAPVEEAPEDPAAAEETPEAPAESEEMPEAPAPTEPETPAPVEEAPEDPATAEETPEAPAESEEMPEAPAESAEAETPAAPALEPPTSQPEPVAEPAEATEAAPQPTAPVEPAAVDPFAGGTQTELTFSRAIDHATLRDLFIRYFGSEASLPPLELSNADFERGDSTAYEDWTLKLGLPPKEARPIIETIRARLEDSPYFPSSNSIGGKVASDTRNKAITALIASLICIVGYLWIRFQRVMFGLAAVVALVHDVLVTLGVIALSFWLSKLPGFEDLLLIDPFKIGLPALAAFLTIIGYSLNDTIVVFDRIREVRGKAPQLTEDMVNTSINQTLARTLLTSLTTLMVVVILYFGGGQGIHGFAFALVVGVIVGTYSSVFVASPALLWMSRPSKSSQGS